MRDEVARGDADPAAAPDDVSYTPGKGNKFVPAAQRDAGNSGTEYCGCDPLWPDHRCGPSAPDTFDPASEV